MKEVKEARLLPIDSLVTCDITFICLIQYAPFSGPSIFQEEHVWAGINVIQYITILSLGVHVFTYQYASMIMIRNQLFFFMPMYTYLHLSTISLAVT